ncbi:glycosyltransferase family 4 protein [Chloroflexia bacterium SDU3-3]|nr:glycosyltransferase family 4 protein [Chloroflexia bacterium SDU3-3]
MHIGIDASRMAVAARTGTEHYTYELLAALAQRDTRSRYTLYCNQMPAALPPLGSNFALRRIPFPRLWTHARLSGELLARAPDVLFVPAHVVPLGAPALRRTRTVVTIHDMGYIHFPEAHARAHRLYLRLSTAWSARVASHVIAISGATRDDLVRHARVPAEKIQVVHHGVAPRFRPCPPEAVAQARERHGLAGAPYVLFVGTVQPRKNLERLIEAFAALGEAERAGARLAIAGKLGWLTQAIEQKAAALGVAEHIRFLGYVPDADVPALLTGAAAFAFPSLYEGFGMPVLEAMACGTPVLTSTTSSLPEVAGDAALLVDPRDTAAITAGLARLLGDAALRADLAARGMRRAAQFTWDACARATLPILLGA